MQTYDGICWGMQSICKEYVTHMQIYALCKWKYARHMQCICITYASHMQTYAGNMQRYAIICRNMQGISKQMQWCMMYARHVQSIFMTYAGYAVICITFKHNMHTYKDICKVYARHMQTYACICLHMYCVSRHMHAYADICKEFAKICIPHVGICSHMHGISWNVQTQNIYKIYASSMQAILTPRIFYTWDAQDPLQLTRCLLPCGKKAQWFIAYWNRIQ